MDSNATVEPKTAMDKFTRTMKALFKVQKSEVEEKPKERPSVRDTAKKLKAPHPTSR